MLASSRLCGAGLLAGLWLSALAQAANASPVTCTFTASGPAFGSTGAPTFSSGATVSGSFTYDPAVSASGTASNGGTLYAGSFLSLAGSVDGHVFSDSSGETRVGNDVTSAVTDIFAFRADPPQGEPGPRNLVGFTIAGQELLDVRLFWIEGQLGITDFLVDENLLGAPPAFQGRLALDFVPIGNPSGTLQTVFFDGLFVTVPEPSAVAMAVLALPLLRRAGLRRRQSPA